MSPDTILPLKEFTFELIPFCVAFLRFSPSPFPERNSSSSPHPHSAQLFPSFYIEPAKKKKLNAVQRCKNSIYSPLVIGVVLFISTDPLPVLLLLLLFIQTGAPAFPPHGKFIKRAGVRARRVLRCVAFRERNVVVPWSGGALES